MTNPFYTYISDIRFLDTFFLVGGPCGVMVKPMDCGIVVREFIHQLCYYVHFQANTLGKGMNPLVAYPHPKIYDQDTNMWNRHIHMDAENVHKCS